MCGTSGDNSSLHSSGRSRCVSWYQNVWATESFRGRFPHSKKRLMRETRVSPYALPSLSSMGQIAMA